MPWDYGVTETPFWSTPLNVLVVPVLFTHTDGRTWRSHEMTLAPVTRGQGDAALGRGRTRQWLHQTMRVRHDELEAGTAHPTGFFAPEEGRGEAPDADLFLNFNYSQTIDRSPRVAAYTVLKLAARTSPDASGARRAAEGAWALVLDELRELG